MEKEYYFPRQGFIFTVAITVRNVSADAAAVSYSVRTIPAILPDDEPNRYFSIEAILAGREAPDAGLVQVKVNSAKAPGMDVKDLRLSSVVNEWEALNNRYFTVIAAPSGPVSAFYAASAVPTLKDLEREPSRFIQPNIALFARGDLGWLDPGRQNTVSFRVYAGPRCDALLAPAGVDETGRDRNFGAVVVYGYGFFAKFDWLSRILLAILNLFARLIPNYGIAIFLLTLTVKLIMHPLQKKAFVNMHKMSTLAPEVAAIKRKYENDKSADAMRRMNAEMMEMYRRHGVSPLGGCLPMLVQLPMFFALYGTLRSAFELRHQGFLWVDDLTRPDHLFTLPFTMPYFGWTTFNLLPVLYVALIILQQKMQPQTNDPQQQQQRRMMMIMPLMFFFIFYNMPSGLVFYFVVSNILSIGEQWLIKRNSGGAPAAAAAASSGGAAEVYDASRVTSWDRAAEREEKLRQKRDEQKRKRQNRLMP